MNEIKGSKIPRISFTHVHVMKTRFIAVLCAITLGAAPATQTFAMPQNTPNPNPITQMQQMTLEQKIGQVMLVGFDGTSLTRELRKMMNDIRPGGIIIFERNVQSPRQLAELIAGLQDMARANGSPPLFVAIDQEGGTVARLRESRGFTEYPSAMAIAATGDPANASAAAHLAASELRALGFNINFAPVLDVNNNPRNPVIAQRSFGSDPAQVAQFGVAYIQALQADGILAVGKHFPGHGDVMTDSHASLPNVPYARERLDAVELAPFRAAIRASVAGIMTAHITFPELDADKNLPATLSSAILQNILRGQMGFDGLIFSDSLDMGALADSGHPLPGAAGESLAAGADVLDFNTDAALLRRVKKDMLARAEADPAFITRLDEAVTRILRAKNLLSFGEELGADDLDLVGSAQNRATAQDLANKAITLVKDDAALVPLAPSAKVLVVETPQANGLGKLLGATAHHVGEKPGLLEIRRAIAAAKNKTLIVVATSDVAKNPAQANLVDELMNAGLPVIVAAVRSPYDLVHLRREPAAYLASYGSSPLMLRALADVLSGRRVAQGHLPVELGR